MYRKNYGLSLRQVSKSTELSVPFLSEVERGDCSISIQNLQKICNCYDISLSDFFDNVEI